MNDEKKMITKRITHTPTSMTSRHDDCLDFLVGVFFSVLFLFTVELSGVGGGVGGFWLLGSTQIDFGCRFARLGLGASALALLRSLLPSAGLGAGALAWRGLGEQVVSEFLPRAVVRHCHWLTDGEAENLTLPFFPT